MHSLYKPRPGRVKDYIAIPKANGYQSLHTSLIGPHGVPVEVQIRTEDMDQMAEMGVDAHWAYKEREQGETGTTAQIRAQRWMQSLLELQQSAGSSFEFIESVKSDLFPDEIYVFTPEGRIVELPAGATPVDFAYAVHTDIGHACVGARVDRQPYPLSQSLTSGQTVEIITAPGARPNAAAEFRGQLESARQNSPDAEESQARRLRRPRPPSAQPRVGRQPQAGRNPAGKHSARAGPHEAGDAGRFAGGNRPRQRHERGGGEEPAGRSVQPGRFLRRA